MLMTDITTPAADLRQNQALQILRDHIETCPTGSQNIWATKQQRLALPYCVELIDGALLPLNRGYKLLGMAQLFHYLDYKPFVPALGIDPAAIPGKVEDQRHYFFNDGNPPWAGKRYMVAYLERVSEFFGFDDLRDRYPQMGSYR